MTSVAFNANSQDSTDLGSVTLSCLQHTDDITLNLGFVSITWHVLVTVCDNGTEYYDLV
jgi:hypothetical protein